jgi:hypothetical protein
MLTIFAPGMPRIFFLSGVVMLIALVIVTTPWTLRAARLTGSRAVLANWLSLVGVFLSSAGVLVDLALAAFYRGPACVQGITDRQDFRIPVCSICLPLVLAALTSMIATIASFAVLPPWRKPLRQQLVRILHVAAVYASLLASMMYCRD